MAALVRRRERHIRDFLGVVRISAFVFGAPAAAVGAVKRAVVGHEHFRHGGRRGFGFYIGYAFADCDQIDFGVGDIVGGVLAHQRNFILDGQLFRYN